jgi:predicted component of type VI protein secretion system
MPLPLKYFDVNWVNGMKIKKDHLVQQEDAFKERVKDVAAIFLNDLNYGLLPLGCGIESSFKFTSVIDSNNFLKVRINQCRAVTQGGARIEILDSQSVPEFSINLTKEIGLSLNEGNNNFYIILSIDLFTRETFGDLNAEEEPSRFPFSIPSFKINILPENHISRYGIHPNSLITGKISYYQNKPEIDEEYMPACMTINSHNLMISFFKLTEKNFTVIEVNLLSIIKKIKEKNQDSSLALSVLKLSESLLNFLSNNFLQFRLRMKDLPPIFLFEFIATFARIFRNTIESSTSVGKEELLNYFTNWSELKQGELEKLLVACINFEYKHFEIAISIEQFSGFMQIIGLLFEKLDSLAYIGKKKDTNIFVKEDKPRRSFLID